MGYRFSIAKSVRVTTPRDLTWGGAGGALSILREHVPTLSFHKSHVYLDVQVKIYVLQKRGDLEVKWGGGEV